MLSLEESNQQANVVLHLTLDACRYVVTWERLAKSGACDAAGGQEYYRVYDEWLHAGRPRDIATFILLRANKAVGR